MLMFVIPPSLGQQYGTAKLGPQPPLCENEAMETNRWDVVIFDYGRVLSHAPDAAEVREFANLVGVSEPPFFQLYSGTRDEYDCGRQDCQQHWQRFARAAGISLTADRVRRIVEFETRMWLRVNQQALDLAREIKFSGVRLAILSNMPPDLLGELRRNFEWLDEFEVQIWSCEHGIVKPGEAIYRLCLQQLGCEPQRALFFDDRPNNVEAARQVGIEAHVFESAEQAGAIVRAGLSVSKLARTEIAGHVVIPG
jgi:putative hydrolase of the HAD superfamily